MTVPRVPSYGTVVVKALADLPARILGGTGIQVNVAGFDYRIDLDIEELQTSPMGAANGKYTAVWDSVDGTYKKIEFTELPAPALDWSVITGKPATYPPTLPILELNVVNLPADLAARPTEAPIDGHTYGRKNGAWSDVATGVSFTVGWADVTGKPTTFPPSAHSHPTSDVTGLDTALAGLQPTAQKAVANGYASLDSGGKVPVAQLPAAALFADAPSDGNTYGRLNTTWNAINNTFVAKTGNTGAGNLPAGTLAQRPGAAAGLIRFNTDSQSFEGCNTAGTWAGLGGGVYVGITAPSSPKQGDLWWKSDSGLMLLYYDDGSSFQWVVTTPSMDTAGLDTRYAQGGGSAGMFKVSSGVVSVAGILDIVLPAGYFAFDLLLKDFTPTVAGGFAVRMALVDTATFVAAAYFYAYNQVGHTGINAPAGSASGDRIVLAPLVTPAITAASFFKLSISQPAAANYAQHILWDGLFHSGTLVTKVNGGGWLAAGTGIVKAVRLFYDGGNPNVAVGASWQLNGYK